MDFTEFMKMGVKGGRLQDNYQVTDVSTEGILMSAHRVNNRLKGRVSLCFDFGGGCQERLASPGWILTRNCRFG